MLSQRLEAQSESLTHALPVEHRSLQASPPQSTSVSSRFLKPSEHEGKADKLKLTQAHSLETYSFTADVVWIAEVAVAVSLKQACVAISARRAIRTATIRSSFVLIFDCIEA